MVLLMKFPEERKEMSFSELQMGVFQTEGDIIVSAR
jgi:hypothetical protein